MCPLYPVHLVLMYGALLVGVWMAGLGTVMAAASEVSLLKVRLHVNDTPVDTLDIKEGEEKMVTFYLDDLPIQVAGDILLKDENNDHLNHIEVKPERIPLTALEKEEPDSPSPSGSFNVSGKFLGFTRVRLVLSDGNDQELMASEPVQVKVAVAGLLLPWLGFVFGAVMALMCRRSMEEIIAISIETGIQNTGIAIGILKVALGDFAPLGDIAMVIPVAVATMTPIPLTVAYIFKRVQECRGKTKTLKFDIPFDDNDNHTLASSTSPLNKSPSDFCGPIAA